eukprot:TRINITY_DN1648_c0_g2_i1.p1 TRINITY_DN1648_c0_g2~~TRINITY_DN1648_c0_g2_i1.p1  ORF type:complete len:180 (-),score=85.78 TRINITY_DN1648_c0_g2_i1:50-589(-)
MFAMGQKVSAFWHAAIQAEKRRLDQTFGVFVGAAPTVLAGGDFPELPKELPEEDSDDEESSDEDEDDDDDEDDEDDGDEQDDDSSSDSDGKPLQVKPPTMSTSSSAAKARDDDDDDDGGGGGSSSSSSSSELDNTNDELPSKNTACDVCQADFVARRRRGGRGENARDLATTARRRHDV